MKKISEYLPMILCMILSGCEINTPPLPPIDRQSFSYEQVMQQQEQLEEEISDKIK